MRYTPAFTELPLHLLLDPRRVLRWVWLGRVVLVCAILAAAAFVWSHADPEVTLVATLAFAVTMLGTSVSAMYAEVYRLPVGRKFHLLQCAMDLLLVTAIVHITGGWSSQFAALYILVIAASALLLPQRSGYAVAVLASILYCGDLVWLRGEAVYLGMAVQSIVFIIVGIGADAIAARLRNAGWNREELAAKLVKVQLEAADILRSIRSGIITVDAQGRLLYANPAATDLLGLHLRGFTGRPVLRTLREVAPELSDLLERSAHNGERVTRAEGVIRRDGASIAIGVTTTTIEHGTNDFGQTATAIFQDITDTKRVQALHIRAERLQAVAELSASLAHEIRNPLASIRSATEQLAQRRQSTLGPGDEDERILHGLVVREADRLDRLLAEFLDFARARATRMMTVDVPSVVDAAVRMVRSHPSCSKETAVSVEVDGVGLTVEGDEDLLHRALFNLLLNAVQAVAPSGHVAVDVRWHDADACTFAGARNESPSMIRITVSDNGAGVPYELRDKLFEPFVTGRTGGSGLGLPVVHRAVESHDGVVFVDHLETGTRFTILLPSGETTTALPDVGSIYGNTRLSESPASTTRVEPVPALEQRVNRSVEALSFTGKRS